MSEIRKLRQALPATPESVLTSVDLVCAADITPKAIRWLWPGWLAQGKLAILAGVGGTGKTTVAMSMAAIVSTAGRWPDGTPCRDHGSVLIWSSEDDPADTIIPRLMAAGADLSRVHIIRGAVTPDGEALPFDPARDIPMLRRKIAVTGGASLLIVDPIVSAVSGDMHKANDVRKSLQELVDFAAAFGCAVVGISHFSKGSKGASPADRVIGSQAFSALARIVLVCAKQDDSETRVLARAKSNISRDDGGFSYSLDQIALPGNIEASRVEWGDSIEGSAREILGEVEAEPDNSGVSERSDAEQFLRDLLIDGPVPSRQVKSDADGAGYSWATTRRAQKAIGVVAYRDGDGIGQKSAWYWRLPGKADLPKVLTEPLRCSGGKGEHLRGSVSTLGETTADRPTDDAEEFEL